MSDALNGSDIAGEVKEQRDASQRWFQANYWPEMSEVYKNYKCRVKPNVDAKGNEITDQSNICLPDHFVMVRRGVARLTANPPSLRVRGGQDQSQRDKVSAMLMTQWDRSGEQRNLRRNVQSAKLFGWAVNKTWYDRIEVNRRLRVPIEQLPLSRVMQEMGAPPEEVQQALAARGGQDVMTPEEADAAKAELGESLFDRRKLIKYDGPIGGNVFIGDISVEPGFRSLQQSSYVIESTERDVGWLEFWAKQTTMNPSTGQEQPVFADVEALNRVVAVAKERRSQFSTRTNLQFDFRKLLRDAVNKTDPDTGGHRPRLPVARFMVDERHSRDDAGVIRVDYVAEGDVYLGSLWYPWDTYGRYIYSELVLIPDVLGGIGDSTPRISRYLMQLRNTRVNQTTDFISNLLRPWGTKLNTADLTDEASVRTAFGKFINVKNHSDLQFRQDPPFPTSAWQDQAQYVREMQQVDPATADFAPGGDTVPQPGKLATGLILQQKATDTVTQDELNQLNFFIKEIMELRLWMNQQAMESAMTIERGEMQRMTALSFRTDATGPVSITVDPMEIQEDFDLFPEAGSTLAQDDEFKRAAIERGFLVAAQHPDVFNKQAFAQKLAQTIPGMDAQEALAAEPPPEPGPQVRINFSVTAKFEELPGDVQAAVLGLGGLPTEGIKITAGLNAVEKFGRATEAADQMLSPSTEGQEDDTNEVPA
jgi:hypothetical protein